MKYTKITSNNRTEHRVLAVTESGKYYFGYVYPVGNLFKIEGVEVDDNLNVLRHNPIVTHFLDPENIEFQKNDTGKFKILPESERPSRMLQHIESRLVDVIDDIVNSRSGGVGIDMSKENVYNLIQTLLFYYFGGNILHDIIHYKWSLKN